MDLHTVSSKKLFKDVITKEIIDGKEKEIIRQVEAGWDTKYTDIGEHLNKLKYWGERNHVQIIAREAANFINAKAQWQIHKIIPMPPSDATRYFQPVYELAKAIGIICNLEVDFITLKKLKSTSQLKDIESPEQRKEILKDAFDIQQNVLTGKNVLLFDDLYRSGETLNAASDMIKNKGNAANIYVLTITKTRSKK
ncbi:MAG TPA: ComF family protein [Bacteroidia bacterium]|nr:ComF family protein [Bacteroidia bacterium]